MMLKRKKILGIKNVGTMLCVGLLAGVFSGYAQNGIKIGAPKILYSKFIGTVHDMQNLQTYSPFQYATATWFTPPHSGLYIDAPLIPLINASNNTYTFTATNCQGIDIWSGANTTIDNPFSDADHKGYPLDKTIYVYNGTTKTFSDPAWVGGVYTPTNFPAKVIDPSDAYNYRINENRLRRHNPILNKTIIWTTFMDEPWIPNVYRDPQTGDILGFVHVETSIYAVNDGPYTIGIALSKDKGNHWVYCGDIIGTKGHHGPPNNIGGIPYIIHNDSFYVYYNDNPVPNWTPYNYSGTGASRTLNYIKRQCVARAKVSDILSVAETNYTYYYNNDSHNQPGSQSSVIPAFYKLVFVDAIGNYSNDTTATINWQDNLGTKTNAMDKEQCGANIIPDCPFLPRFAQEVCRNCGGNNDIWFNDIYYDFHADAAYCTPLHKYLITVSTGLRPYDGQWTNIGGFSVSSRPGALLLYSSVDGIHWCYHAVVDSGNAPYMQPVPSQYGQYSVEKPHSTFIASLNDNDASEYDSHVVGKIFYIYYIRHYWPAADMNTFLHGGGYGYFSGMDPLRNQFQELYSRQITVIPNMTFIKNILLR